MVGNNAAKGYSVQLGADIPVTQAVGSLMVGLSRGAETGLVLCRGLIIQVAVQAGMVVTVDQPRVASSTCGAFPRAAVGGASAVHALSESEP